MKRIDRTTTLDDLAADPESYGLPTFEQFQMLRDQFVPREDDAMAALSDGPKQFRKDLVKIKFQVNGRNLSSEEEVERALGDHGFGLGDIDLENRNSRLKKDIQMVPLGGGKFDIVVNFIP